MREAVERGVRALADLFLPRVCVVCGTKLGLEERFLCRPCSEDMPLTRFWQLRHNQMADKFNFSIQKELEKKWSQRPTRSEESEPSEYTHTLERYAFAIALFYFNEDADYKKIPYRIKYEGDTNAGYHFGALLGNRLLEARWMSDVDVIIPVPLHWKRKWRRGYNQAEIIAKGVSSAIGAPVRTDILRRRRNTLTQINLDIKEKASNVAGAFIARMPDPKTISKFSHTLAPLEQTFTDSEHHIRHILLIDDVFTTGSTLTACFTALREVFPPSVRISIATLAYVGGP